MFRTVLKFAGLPLAAVSAVLVLSAGSASAQRIGVAPPRIDVDALVGQCVVKTAGYSQFQACVAAALDS